MRARFLILSILTFFSLTLGGCYHDLSRNYASMPLGQLLQPAQDSRQLSGKVPLTLPVTVAIVNVPGMRGFPATTLRSSAEKLKEKLLAYPKYVSSVAVVPEEEVKDGISLSALRAAYSADVVITLSYQQDQRTAQSGAAGLMDTAVVGNFLVPGVEIKTSSLVDGRVIHIPNNAIVFRASGNDRRTKHSTSYAENGNAEEQSIESLVAATADFGEALGKTMSKFDHYDFSQAVPVSAVAAPAAAGDRKQPANDYWGKVDTYKSTGGRALGAAPLAAALGLWLVARRRG